MSEVTEAENKFLEYDWGESVAWQEYIRNLYPTPNSQKILKYKRKWFQKYIDSNLDLNVNDGNETRTDKSSSFRSASSNSSFCSSSTGKMPFLIICCVLLECFSLIFSFLYLLPFFPNSSSAYMYNISWLCMTLSYLLEIRNKLGGIRFNQVYMQNVLLNENGEALLFVFFTLLISRNPFILIPLLITIILNLSNHFVIYYNRLPSFIKNNETIRSNAIKINNQRIYLMQIRSDMEVAFGMIMILLLFIGGSTVISIFLYWNLLKLRYSMNPYTSCSFRKLNGYISKVVFSPNCPSIFGKIYNKIKSLCFSQSVSDNNYAYANERNVERSSSTRGFMNRFCIIQ